MRGVPAPTMSNPCGQPPASPAHVARVVAERDGLREELDRELRRGTAAAIRIEELEATLMEVSRGRGFARPKPTDAGLEGAIRRPEVKVACLLNTDTEAAYSHEVSLLPLNADTDAVERRRPDVLLVEHAAGRDPRSAARRCRECGVPTVLWDTEQSGEPAPYARDFDHVLVAVPGMVTRYRDRLGHPSVHVLTPGAQPRIHNPVATPIGRRRPISLEDPSASRKIVDLVAAGCTVVGTEDFDDVVFRPSGDGPPGPLLRMLLRNPELRDRIALRGVRTVMREHTCAHRIDALLGLLGRPAPRKPPTVSIVCSTKRPAKVTGVLAAAARQTHRPLELVLVLHGINADEAALRGEATAAGVELTVLRADPELTLGAAMNLGCEAAQGAILSKMDDDNFYGANYLEDLVHAFGYTEADVVGKWAVYTLLESTRTLLLRYGEHEHRYTTLVQGGTLTTRRETWEDLRFPDLPRSVDTMYLRAVADAGGKTYSADRFNFVSIRGGDQGDHTWQIADEELLTRGGVVHVYGANLDHVVV